MLLTVAAATVLVLVAFLLPLALLVGNVAENRATNNATLTVQTLVPLLSTVGRSDLQLAVEAQNGVNDFAVTVFLPTGAPVGAPAEVDAAVDLAATGRPVTVDVAAGRKILVPVQGLTDGTAVIQVFIPSETLASGVAKARLVLVGLGLVLLGLALAVGNAVAASLLRPVRDLADTANRLAGGDLTARVDARGPPETRAVGRALNRLADRIGELLAAERETVADLSHRLRTPVTALRLDAEGLADGAERTRLTADVAELSRLIDEVIREARRPEREGLGARSDARQVVADRVRFWAVLAEDTDRHMDVDLPDRPVLVRCSPEDCAITVDALLGNVFAHTPDGTPFEVRLVARPGGGATLVVRDDGPGLPALDVTARGTSAGGSTGLGLDIVRRTAEAAGGSLRIGTSPAGGTQVAVDVPGPLG
jgi:signal transduction histidine kinase